MSVTITATNIDQYRSGSWPDVKKLVWKVWPLDVSVLQNFPSIRSLDCSGTRIGSLAGLKGCPQLLKLECVGCGLSSLEGLENTPLLQVLICSDNWLSSLVGIEDCRALETLECNGSTADGDVKLESLAGLENCTMLRQLVFCHNHITSLAQLALCTLLNSLHCENNRLQSLAGIEGCTRLSYLFCFGNQLTSLTEIRFCPQLGTLMCSSNRIQTLDGIQFCTRLEILLIYRNQIRTLEHVVYLRHLHTFSCSDNPLDIQTIQVQRFLERIRPRNRKVNQSIYADGQNIHDTHIQKTVCDSVQNLLTDPKPEFTVEMIVESGMSERSIRIILEYCDDTSVHSIHFLTYTELLGHVWARICKSEHKDELIKILEEQITDSECKCFTGRFNRTLSVLVGFYDDIAISISDNSRIGAIIIAALEQVVPYCPDEHRTLALKLLLEAGYTDEEVQPWLEAIV